MHAAVLLSRRIPGLAEYQKSLDRKRDWLKRFNADSSRMLSTCLLLPK